MKTRSVAIGAAVVVLVLQGCASGRRAAEVEYVPSGWPVARASAVVTSEFGAPRGKSRHKGIDLSAPAGTPATVTADGVVAFADRSGDFGRLVIIDHGAGWQTRYAHLKRIKVKNGKKVARGDVIGTIGKSGNATGNHLHYEVRRDGRAVDPRPYLR